MNTQISIEIQDEPLAMLLERDEHCVTALLNVHLALSLATDLLYTPRVLKSILLPAFMKRWLLRVLLRSFQKARKEFYGLPLN